MSTTTKELLGGGRPLFDFLGTIVFLDFDGVLHPHNEKSRPWHEQEGPLSRLPLLEAALCNKKTPIVVTSSWRLSYPEDVLKDMMGSLASQYVGKTPDLTGQVPVAGSRQREVETWLRANAPKAKWVALDDDFDGFDEDCDNMIWCDPDIGVSLNQLITLKNRLDIETF